MARPKTINEEQRREQLDRVAELDRRGHTQNYIAKQLGISQSMVSLDLRQIMEGYKGRLRADRDLLISEKVAQLRDIRAQAWVAYDRSMLDKGKVVEEFGKPIEAPEIPDVFGNRNGWGKKSKKRPSRMRTMEESMERLKRIVTTEGRLPANEYLSTILKTVEMECSLLGLNAPTKVETTQNLIDWNAVLSGMASTEGVEKRLIEALPNDRSVASPADYMETLNADLGPIDPDLLKEVEDAS